MLENWGVGFFCCVLNSDFLISTYEKKLWMAIKRDLYAFYRFVGSFCSIKKTPTRILFDLSRFWLIFVFFIAQKKKKAE